MKSVVEWKCGGDQRSRIDFPRRQRLDCRREPAASRSQHRNLIDDDRREVEIGGCGRGAFQNQRSARTHQFDSARESSARAGAIDDDIVTIVQILLVLDGEAQSLRAFRMMSRR